MWEHYERVRIEVEELLDAGDQVVAVTTLHAVPKRGQQEMTFHIVEVFTIRDGLLAERRSYSTRNEALEAAGRVGARLLAPLPGSLSCGSL